MTSATVQPGFRDLLRSDARASALGERTPFFYLAALLGLNKFSAVLLFRMAATLAHKGRAGRFLAAALTRLNTLYNSCEMSPLARIGPGLHIAHTIGICFGPITAGRNLTILHHASLGLDDRNVDHVDPANFPTIGDGVQIGPGAVLLGPISVSTLR